MNTNKLVGFMAAMAFALLAADTAEAFYHSGMGRFINRDPSGQGVITHRPTMATSHQIPPGGEFLERDPSGDSPDAQYADGMNLYQYVASSPPNYSDPSGLFLFGGIGNPGFNGGSGWSPGGKSSPDVGPVTSLPSNSPECDEYACSDSYAGANARCFCKCAGDSPWANYVRGCLRKLYEEGATPHSAHMRCYNAADSKFPGGQPTLTLLGCYAKCVGNFNGPHSTPSGHKHWGATPGYGFPR